MRLSRDLLNGAEAEVNAGLAAIITEAFAIHSIDLFWNGRALAPPQPPTGIVDHADGGHLL